MEKIIKHSGEKFKIRHYFDADVKKSIVDPDTGEIYERRLGDIEGIEIYSSTGELLGSFDYVDFENNKLIKKVIGQIY
ncbi:MAG TPA: hypothetical protein DHV62_02220 [Elusimicrobia bacterium]|jgi:hypothetical protein|nr:hypothetical protein [Elusimicrobiota bacterium]